MKITIQEVHPPASPAGNGGGVLALLAFLLMAVSLALGSAVTLLVTRVASEPQRVSESTTSVPRILTSPPTAPVIPSATAPVFPCDCEDRDIPPGPGQSTQPRNERRP